MKYLIVPVFKILWAIPCLMFSLSVLIITTVIYTLWNFKFPPKKSFVYTYVTASDFNWSPFYKRNPNYYGAVEFPSELHYIFGLQENWYWNTLTNKKVNKSLKE